MPWDNLGTTWPAFWTYNSENNWPLDGEIDILEGIGGTMVYNVITLHTRDGCWMQNKDWIYFTGQWAPDEGGKINATNCYVNATGKVFSSKNVHF